MTLSAVQFLPHEWSSPAKLKAAVTFCSLSPSVSSTDQRGSPDACSSVGTASSQQPLGPRPPTPGSGRDTGGRAAPMRGCGGRGCLGAGLRPSGGAGEPQVTAQDRSHFPWVYGAGDEITKLRLACCLKGPEDTLLSSSLVCLTHPPSTRSCPKPECPFRPGTHSACSVSDHHQGEIREEP